MMHEKGTMAVLKSGKDCTAAVLRKSARAEDHARVARCILAMANALDGMSLEDAARSADMGRHALRD